MPVNSVGSTSIPTIHMGSVSEMPDICGLYAAPTKQADTSSRNSTAMGWPSSSEHSTAPPASPTCRTACRTPAGSATPSASVPVAALSSRHAPSISPSPSPLVPVALSDPCRSPTPASVASSIWWLAFQHLPSVRQPRLQLHQQRPFHNPHRLQSVPQHQHPQVHLFHYHHWHHQPIVQHRSLVLPVHSSSPTHAWHGIDPFYHF
jgi:hypothetical protein